MQFLNLFLFRFLFFTFVLPLVQTVVYNLCVGHNIHSARFGIVNDEVINCSADLYREKCFLNDSDTKLSCMLIDHLREYNALLVNKTKILIWKTI